MTNIELFSLKQIGKAIKALDEFRSTEQYLGSKINVKRVDKSRVNLLNVLLSNGYELVPRTYNIIKSQSKRQLIKFTT